MPVISSRESNSVPPELKVGRRQVWSEITVVSVCDNFLWNIQQGAESSDEDEEHRALMIKPGSAEKEDKENEAFFKRVRFDIGLPIIIKQNFVTVQDTQSWCFVQVCKNSFLSLLLNINFFCVCVYVGVVLFDEDKCQMLCWSWSVLRLCDEFKQLMWILPLLQFGNECLNFSTSTGARSSRRTW